MTQDNGQAGIQKKFEQVLLEFIHLAEPDELAFLRGQAPHIARELISLLDLQHGLKPQIESEAQARKSCHQRGAVMSDLISLDEARRKARPDYVNSSQIESLLDALEVEIGDITRGSMNAFGAVDTLAFEINSHVVAIRRALAASIDTKERD